MTTEKTYEFYGIDAKTEIRIVLIGCICMAFLWGLSLTICHKIIYINFDEVPTKMFVGLGMASAGLTFMVTKYLGNRYNKLWMLEKLSDKLIIKYGSVTHEILLKDILKVLISGNKGFRYSTIWYKSDCIRIRVGSLGQKTNVQDCEKMDLFVVQELMPYLRENFIRKDKNNSRGQYLRNKYGVPSFFGIYIRK